MAGRQDAILAIGGPNDYYKISARPSSPLATIPYLGPLWVFNLGERPTFKLTVDYLGYKTPGDDDFDPDVKPASQPDAQDVILMINDVPADAHDDLPIDVSTLAFEMKRKTFVTKPTFLQTGGFAQLQVGLGDYHTVYSFEIREAAPILIGPLIAVVSAGVGGVVGWFLNELK